MNENNLGLVALDKLVKSCVKQYIEDMEKSESSPNLHALVLSAIEKSLIEVVMAETNKNQNRTSDLLGINRNTLRRKIKVYSINTQKQLTKQKNSTASI